MTTYRTPLLVGVFILGMVVFSGCDCGEKAECASPPPVAVAKPLPPPSPPSLPPPPRPQQGVCWVDPIYAPVRMADPPTVTLDRQGAVVSATPPGRVQPPPPRNQL